jgi:hypothetical protein
MGPVLHTNAYISIYLGIEEVYQLNSKSNIQTNHDLALNIPMPLASE